MPITSAGVAGPRWPLPTWGTLAADLHSARCHTAGPVGVSGFRLGSHCGATSWASCMAGASRRVAPRSC